MTKLAIGALAAAVLLAAGAARAADAATIYVRKCATCHGRDGKGQTRMGERLGVKDLSTASAATPEALEKTIADGRGKMPGFKGKLSDDELKAVAAYVKAGLK